MKKFPSHFFRSIIMIAGFGIIAVPLMAGAKSTDHKVTGGAAGDSAFGHAQFEVAVTEGFSASVAQSDLQKNSFTYANDNGLTYSVDVRFSSFDQNAVWFTGQIVASSDPSMIGLWVVTMVQDNGRPGSAHDVVAMRSTTAPSIAFNMVANHSQYLWDSYDITDGNLMVH